jgi:flagellar M-ring protein FliF
MKGVLEGLKALGPARLAAMAIVGLGVMTLMLVLAMRGGTSHMALLYGELDLREASQMADALERQHIAHQVGGGGTEILVPAEQVGQARLLLAHDGLPSGGSIGYEIFDRGDGMLSSQFTQAINQTRALEGELARTIQTIRGVRAARVHVVLPHREPFARAQQDAQASVLLTLAGSGRLDREEVQAILNLVAAAVPGLKLENIALIDNRGQLLARAGQPTEPLAVAATLDEMRHATEARLSHAVEEMLERSLGPGRAQAEANVEMDLDQVHETQEKYDPDGQVVRSTQTVTDNTHSSEGTPPTSVQNNLPNAAAAASDAAGSQEQRQEETTNYEIGRTVRNIVHEHPQIHRISIAVLVDGMDAKDDKGVVQWRPRTPEELDHISALVRSAIGYDEKRGDHVEVVNMRFAHEDIPDPGAPLLGMNFDKADAMRLAQTGLIGLLGIAALAFVLRPTVLKLARASTADGNGLALAGPGGGPSGLLAAAQRGADGSLPFAVTGNMARLTGPEGAVEHSNPEMDAMVDVANIEGQIRASSVRKIAELVEKHPDESLSIVRNWMHQETH